MAQQKRWWLEFEFVCSHRVSDVDDDEMQLSFNISHLFLWRLSMIHTIYLRVTVDWKLFFLQNEGNVRNWIIFYALGMFIRIIRQTAITITAFRAYYIGGPIKWVRASTPLHICLRHILWWARSFSPMKLFSSILHLSYSINQFSSFP